MMFRNGFPGGRVIASALAALALFAACSCVAGCGSSGGKQLSIDEVKLEKDDMQGYSLKEFKATRANAEPGSIVGELYDAGAVNILNQVFEMDGRKVRVNYVQMKDIKAGRQAEAMLEAAVTGTNYVGRKDNIAIEIVGNVEDTGRVAEELQLSL